MQALRERRARDQHGFTVIELMVAVLIIGILITIEIPTLLGARAAAKDRATQADLRQSLLTAKSYYTDTQRYDATAAQLHGLEPSIAFDATIANASQNIVGFSATATDIVLEKLSTSGMWFCIADTATGGTSYGHNAGQAAIDTAATCTGGW